MKLKTLATVVLLMGIGALLGCGRNSKPEQTRNAASLHIHKIADSRLRMELVADKGLGVDVMEISNRTDGVVFMFYVNAVSSEGEIRRLSTEYDDIAGDMSGAVYERKMTRVSPGGGISQEISLDLSKLREKSGFLGIAEPATISLVVPYFTKEQDRGEAACVVR